MYLCAHACVHARARACVAAGDAGECERPELCPVPQFAYFKQRYEPHYKSLAFAPYRGFQTILIPHEWDVQVPHYSYPWDKKINKVRACIGAAAGHALGACRNRRNDPLPALYVRCHSQAAHCAHLPLRGTQAFFRGTW